MKTNLYLTFAGRCREAFAFYETTFGSKIVMTMTWGEAPAGSPVPEGTENLILHVAMPLGGLTLMGCDAPPGQEQGMGGFMVSVDSADADEVKRMFAALSEGGGVQMPLGPTFWSPLFGMCTDKFGVPWMVGISGTAA